MNLPVAPAAAEVVAAEVEDVAVAVEINDSNHHRVGLGWRAPFSFQILAHLDQIDVVEIILDDLLILDKSKLRWLRTLESQVPILYHGVGLGLASTFPVSKQRAESIARVFDYLNPSFWSEHLAFVRAGKIEIGHLAAPPRNFASIEGTLENLITVNKIIGKVPVLENIATLIVPPGSTLTEGEWTHQIVCQSEGSLLLDLHNLYANALNSHIDPNSYLKSFPFQKVKMIHLSGGMWIPEPEVSGFITGQKRLLDDHCHDIPDPVFELLETVIEGSSQPITIIIERDGNFPEFNVILEQIKKIRRILQSRIEKQSRQEEINL